MRRLTNRLPGIARVRRVKHRFLSWYYFGHTRARVMGRIEVGNHRNIHLGKDVVINRGCLLQGYCGITIGDRTVLSPRVMVLDANLVMGGGHKGHPVTIGQDCWIGARAIICPGAIVDDGEMVGAGTVYRRGCP